MSNHKLFVIDDQNPEDIAMMQALYSRSSQSVVQHLEKVKKTGSGKFMASYYVGYNHESIGDCGSTTIFIENVSILAAKAIQDWPLYSGQETSTRYIDMSKQECTDPLNTKESKEILNDWIQFYIESQEELTQFLKEKYKIKPEEKENKKMTDTYNKAIAARAFDILRAFLPAGINTQLAWHTNLRQADKKLALLNHHPDSTIREIGVSIHNELKKKYPHSFCHKLYEETEKYRELVAKSYTYHDNSLFEKKPREKDDSLFEKKPREKDDSLFEKDDIMVCNTNIKDSDLTPYLDIINERPNKTELPNFLLDLGLVSFSFPLDFGSFRDIQRHRNGVCRMPVLTMDLGFHKWYLDQLPDPLKEKALSLIEAQKAKIIALTDNPIIRQYYIPLGFKVSCKVTYGLPAAVYTIELRSGSTVHATLRDIAFKMERTLKEVLPSLKIHLDMNKDEWDIRRGLQDITAK